MRESIQDDKFVVKFELPSYIVRRDTTKYDEIPRLPSIEP